MEKKEKTEVEEKVMVVPELPQQAYNLVQTDDGKTIKLITIQEALTEILESVRAMKTAGLY